MEGTGKFNEALKEHFDADSGAYTHITAEEIRKQTFNVKAVIKNLLVEKIGRRNIPAHGAVHSTMNFNLTEDLAARFGPSRNIVCKFSKPNKDEMTIYFSANDFIPKSELSAGDFWCIYFKSGDSTPWFGFLNSSVMEFIQSQYVGNISIEGDEYTVDSTKKVKPLTYKHGVDDLIIMESKCPSVANVLSKASNKGVAGNRTVSTSDMQCIMSNKKIKGNRGEEIILRVEKDKLIAVNRHDLAAKVEWLSKNTDGLGYDIESYETDPDGKNERKIYIEVKATSQNELTPFFISRNELEVSKNKGNNFYLYRVYNLKTDNKNVNFYKVCGDIESNFELVPQTFAAFMK